MYLTKNAISVPEFLSVTPHSSCGALATFVGIVRDHDHGQKVEKLFYDCYEPMAEKQLCAIVEQTKTQCKVNEIRLLHRIGWMEVGETAVVIAVTSAHREEAFAACREVIEAIKKIVPIWKKQIYHNGKSDWVVCQH